MIRIDMTVAKNIWKNKIRADRQPVLDKLDIEFIRALEDNDTNKQKTIKAKKQLLRDAPSDARIDNAKTPEELLNINPVYEIE